MSRCIQCHFDIKPFVGVTANAVFSARSLASLVRAEEEPEEACHTHTTAMAASTAYFAPGWAL
jgi:hypothetical protein